MAEGSPHTLLITDLPVDTDFDSLGDVDTDGRLTVVPLHHDHRFANSDRSEYRPPNVFMWHEELGRQVHTDLENLSYRIVSSSRDAGSRLTHSPRALVFSIIDAALWDYLLLRRSKTILQSEPSFSAVGLYIKDKKLALAARAAFCGDKERPLRVVDDNIKIFRDVEADTAKSWLKTIPVIMLGSPVRLVRFFAGRDIPADARGWRTVKFQFVAAKDSAKKWIVRYIKPKTSLNREVSQITRPLLMELKPHDAPAIVCWISRDRNYATALIRVLEEIVQTRPVVLLLEGSAGNIKEMLSELNQTSANKVHVVEFEGLYQIARRYGQEIAAAAPSKVAALARDRTLSSIDRAILKHSLASFLATSSRAHILGVVNEFMRQMMSRPFAYGLMASGRSAPFAAVAELLEAAGRPSVDVHIYLVGNHARQIAPPTRYAAVIDDQQEAVVTNFWGWPADRCIRVGYLWRQPVAAETVVKASEGKTTVLICTQPGETGMVKGFFTDVVAALALLKDAEVWVKPHPSETSSVLDFYRNLIGSSIGQERALIFGGADRLTDILPSADVVVTRTSNAGIEAAVIGKPTVRYLAYDKYDRSVEHVVAYAKTVWTPQELLDTMARLVGERQSREDQINAQAPYLEANPAQALADGPARLISFLEERVRGQISDDHPS